MPEPADKPPTTVEVILRLCELGCTVRRLSGEIRMNVDGGDETYVVRYVRNPATNGIWVCSEYADNEGLLPHVIGHIEKLLGVVTGFPSRPRRDQS